MARTKVKRNIETIDLTGDSDDEKAPSQAPKNARLSENSTASTPAEDYNDDDAGEEIDGIVSSSQDALNQAFANYELYGNSNLAVIMQYLTLS